MPGLVVNSLTVLATGCVMIARNTTPAEYSSQRYDVVVVGRDFGGKGIKNR